MRELITRRIAELRAELEAGERLHHELQARQDDLRSSMLRIGGALQVLGELVAEEVESEAPVAAGPREIQREPVADLLSQPRRSAARA